MVSDSSVDQQAKLSALKDKWRSADCVCFDVDSTVCMNEAIDDLANFAGVGDEVRKLTLEAMGGDMSFREALRTRLAIIKPTTQLIEQFNKLQLAQLTPGIKDLIERLHQRSVHVYLISGGFRVVINPVADALGIDRTSGVYANTLLFTDDGEYRGFDESELTSESGGKGKAIEDLKSKHAYKCVIMVGDGATDLESCPPADGFIGFGGNVVREKVKLNSTWFVHDFGELLAELDK